MALTQAPPSNKASSDSVATPHGIPVSKVTRYGWVMVDEPGEMMMLHKSSLLVDPSYQRDAVDSKVVAIASAWSWVSVGAIVVAERDGSFWVIDGQHRVLAAMRRADIGRLPCVVFRTVNAQSEARGFLNINTGRKPITTVAKHKALAAAGDETALYIQEQCDLLGIAIREYSPGPGQLKCLGWCLRRAGDSKEEFRAVLSMGAELCLQDEMPINERVLEGLWQLNAKCGSGLADRRLVDRLRAKGARVLLNAANRAAAYYSGSSGGGRIWAEGMLNEINKGLRLKFAMNDEVA